VASQAAVAMDNADLISELQSHNTGLSFAYDATLEQLSNALDLREQLSHGHSQQLAEWTLTLGEAMGIEGPDLINDRRGALLHDIGKIGVPESILFKPGPLSDEEWKVMHKHPRYAYLLLSEIPYLRAAVPIPYCHHEKWDGSGYPRGLKGKEIPLAARVFSVVEAWDVLGCDRPYREAWPNMKIREHLKSQSGIDFDPEIADKFLELERAGAFTRATPSEEILTLEEATEEKPVDKRVEEKRTEAEPPKEVAAAKPAEPKEEVTQKPREEVTEETQGTVLEKLKGKVAETLQGKVSEEPEETVTEKPQATEPQGKVTPQEPEEADLTLKETVSQEEPEETGLKPKEEVSPEAPKETGLSFKKTVTQEEPKEIGSKVEDKVSPEESKDTSLKFKEKVSPEAPRVIGPELEEKVRPEKPKDTGLKFKDKVSPEAPREIGPKLEEKVGPEAPKEIGPKLEEKVSSEAPKEIGPKLEEKVSSEAPKGTNSEPPMVFSEPLMGTVTQELNETDEEGKVTERLMGITTQEPLETDEKEGNKT